MSEPVPPFMVDGQVVVAPAPPGWEVDLENPERNEVYNRAIWWTLGFGSAFAAFFLGQNLYVRWFMQRQLQVETVLLVLSWVMGLFVTGWLSHSVVIKTTGTHLWEVKMTNFTQFMVIYYACSTVYNIQLAVVKCALALFYHRISPAQWWRWTITTLIVMIVLFTTAITFVSIFACNPVAKSWDPSITGGSCLDRNPLYMTVTAFHVLLDLILIVLPVPVVLGLQMGLRQKIGIILVFVIGGSTLVSSAVRLAVMVPILKATDQTYVMAEAVLWIIIEANLLVICASLPTLRRFISHVAPRLLKDTLDGSSGGQTGGNSGRVAESDGFRTFGQRSDRRRVDQFGMTIDDGPEQDEYHRKPLELKDLGGGEPVKVTVSSLRKSQPIRGASDRHKRHDKTRDAASDSSLDGHQDGAGNDDLPWDPLSTEGDEQAIVQTKSYSVKWNK